MRTVTLNVVDCEHSGFTGLMIEGMINDGELLPAWEGRLLAHDLLEHQNGPRAIGTVADELEALGAGWYIRGQFSDYTRDGTGSFYSADQMLLSEVEDMQEREPNGCSDAILLAPKRGGGVFYDTFMEVTQDINNFAYRMAAVRLLCRGASKARRRFRSATWANSMFWAVATEVDRFLEIEELFPGDIVKLSYSRLEARAKLVREYY